MSHQVVFVCVLCVLSIGGYIIIINVVLKDWSLDVQFVAFLTIILIICTQ